MKSRRNPWESAVGCFGLNMLPLTMEPMGSRKAPKSRGEIIQIAGVFKASVVHVNPKSMVIEVTGDTEKLDAFETIMSTYGIVELARTGKVALSRFSESTELGVDA